MCADSIDENQYGEWCRYSDAQAALAERDREIAALSERFNDQAVDYQQARAQIAGLKAILDEQKQILSGSYQITCRNGNVHPVEPDCLYCRAEKAEAQIAVLRAELTKWKDLCVRQGMKLKQARKE
jgi:DnaJ-domain-containing protein 1